MRSVFTYHYYLDNSKISCLIDYFKTKKNQLDKIIDLASNYKEVKTGRISSATCAILHSTEMIKHHFYKEGSYIEFNSKLLPILQGIRRYCDDYDFYCLTDNNYDITERINHDWEFKDKIKDKNIDGHAMLIIALNKSTKKMNIIDKNTFNIVLEKEYDDIGIFSSNIHPCYTDFKFGVFFRDGDLFGVLHDPKTKRVTGNIYNHTIPSETVKLRSQDLYYDGYSYEEGKLLGAGQPRIDGWAEWNIYWATQLIYGGDFTKIDDRLKIQRCPHTPWNYYIWYYQKRNKEVWDSDIHQRVKNIWKRIDFGYCDEFKVLYEQWKKEEKEGKKKGCFCTIDHYAFNTISDKLKRYKEDKKIKKEYNTHYQI